MNDSHRHPSCLVCDADLAPEPDLSGLLKCGVCGFVTADCSLSDAELAALYGPDYFHGNEYADYALERSALQNNFRRRLDSIAKLYGPLDGANLLEIGSAFGFFLEIAEPLFARALGVEISDAAASYARDEMGLDVRTTDVTNFEPPFRPDVICMWDVIEHLGQPDNVIAWASENISSDGLFCMTTGDIGSRNARMRGAKWRLIHPPTHLHYFSVPSITRLLDRHGFEVVDVSYPPISRSLKGIVHGVLGAHKKPSPLANFLERVIFVDPTISLNLFDIMFIVARRRPAHV